MQDEEKCGLLYANGMRKNNFLLQRFGERNAGNPGGHKLILKAALLECNLGGSRARSAKAVCIAFALPITHTATKAVVGFASIDEIFDEAPASHMTLDSELATIDEGCGNGYESEAN